VKIAIVGSRDFPDATLRVRKCLVKLRRLYGKNIVIVTGGSGKIDWAAINESILLGLRCIIVPARWEELGKYAGPKRNHQIVMMVDKVFAFWDGKSRGTAGVIEMSRKEGKATIVRRKEWKNE
jgi:hypothetical protein